jgi:hypothetical protein
MFPAKCPQSGSLMAMGLGGNKKTGLILFGWVRTTWREEHERLIGTAIDGSLEFIKIHLDRTNRQWPGWPSHATLALSSSSAGAGGGCGSGCGGDGGGGGDDCICGGDDSDNRDDGSGNCSGDHSCGNDGGCGNSGGGGSDDGCRR